MELEQEVLEFFKQWESLSKQILKQGTDHLSRSTCQHLATWQQQAQLLGFKSISPLVDRLLSPEIDEKMASESKEHSSAYGELLYLMEGLKLSVTTFRYGQVQTN